MRRMENSTEQRLRKLPLDALTLKEIEMRNERAVDVFGRDDGNDIQQLSKIHIEVHKCYLAGRGKFPESPFGIQTSGISNNRERAYPVVHCWKLYYIKFFSFH